MIKLLKIILTVLITSFFYFPVNFVFLPSNTKNILAAIGLLFIVFYLIRQKEFSIPKQLLILLLLSCMVSIMSLVSITYNQTPDTTYVTYIRAAIIWLCSAFATGCIIKVTHGRIDIPLVTHYLIGACIFQCVMAMLIEFIPAVQLFVDRYVQQGQDVLKDMGRLYGLGAFLDVAGSRFAVVLVAISFLLVSSPKPTSIGLSIFYTLSFTVITVIGNMIARTTTVGALIGIVWMAVAPLILPATKKSNHNSGRTLAIFGTFAILIVTSIVLYNSFPDVKDLFRFGFEGFFSIFETGEWQTDSTSKLETMIVWPEELRTWIIGDGYFENSRVDPNYLGDSTDRGFYMGTDIGYLRFIYYFGILGMVWIIAVIVYSAYVCADLFKSFQWIFIMALVVGLAVWAKVSTDIFLFFCLFLSAAALQETPGDNTSPDEATEEVEEVLEST